MWHEGEKMEKPINFYENFQEAYQDVGEKLALKTKGEKTECALKILDYMREQGDFNVRTALDILDDAKTVLLELVIL